MKLRGMLAKASLAAGAGVLTVAALAAPAAGATSSCGSSSGKCYSATVTTTSPPVVGASDSFTFQVTNDAQTQQLGSVQITAPPGYVITQAPGAASYTSVPGGSAVFLGLSLQPAQTATLTVTAVVPCSGGDQWGIEAKQSNNFNGPPGNDFQGPAQLSSGTPSGTCSLKFTGEPSGTLAGADIQHFSVTATGKVTAGPVTVEILDGATPPVPVTTSSADVTVTVASPPGIPQSSVSGATTETEQAANGIASFSTLSVSQPPAPGYTLVATSTSPGLNSAQASATSTPFTIYQTLSKCSSSCSGSWFNTTTSASVTTSSGATGDHLGGEIGGASYACGSTQEPSASYPVNVDLLDGSRTPVNGLFSASLEVSKAVVEASGHPGASSWQICYADTSPFTAQSGPAVKTTIAGTTYYTGQLADCSSTQPAPCVVARNKDNAGDVVITFRGAGDWMAFWD